MPDGTSRESLAVGLASGIVVAVTGGLIAVLPSLDSLWSVAGVLVIAAAGITTSTVILLREARRLIVRRDWGEEFTAYEFDEETGVLVKGAIANVSLRVETIHVVLDRLVDAIPAAQKEAVLRDAGYAAGAKWAREFRKTLWQSGLRKDEDARQLLRWSEYDATAGMGRLIVAMDSDFRDGSVMLLNSFLSRSDASFPLNYWFAGYIAGTMDELFGGSHEVKLEDPSARAAALVGFRVSVAG
jgi:hypothetical protein